MERGPLFKVLFERPMKWGIDPDGDSVVTVVVWVEGEETSVFVS